MPNIISPEIVNKRTYNKKYFDNQNGTFTQQAHTGHVHYFNKLGVGDGQVRFRELDWKLAWDETKKGWSFQYHSFQPFLPEYADEWVEFRDLYEGKDQTISYKAQCGHIKGVYFDKLDGITENNGVIYPDAFGEGKDYILHFTRSSLKKVVRIREGYKTSSDQTFDFEIKVNDLPVFRGKDKDHIQYEVDTKKPKAFDTDKHTLIGTDKKDGKEWFTYLRTYQVWDSNTKIVGRQTIPVEFYQKENKLYLKKIITGSYQQKSVGDIFTDTTTSYYSGAGDGICYNGATGVSWATFHALTSCDTVTYTNASEAGGNNWYWSGAGGSYGGGRLFYPIDTSFLENVATVSAATFHFYTSHATANQPLSRIVQTSQASTSSLVAADFDNLTMGTAGSDEITIANGGYNNIALNATGLTWISQTGYTKLGVIGKWDYANDGTYTLDYSHYALMSERFGLDQTQDPYLETTYTTTYPASTIAVDAATNGGDTTGTSLTFAHTCTGTNLILFVGVNGHTASNLITGVTYNGVAMTQIASSPIQVPADRYINLWYLIAPATGAHNVVISASGSAYIAGAAVSYTGVIQTSPIDVDGSNTVASANTLSKSLTTTVDNDWAIMIGVAGGGVRYAGLGTILRIDGGSGTNWGLFDSGINLSPTGSKTLKFDWTASAIGGGIIMAAFKPAPTSNIKTINGLAYASIKTVNGFAIASVKTFNGLA